MDKPVCHVRNLRKSALSGYVSEIDAIATGGHYLTPDASGCFDANFARDLCVTCVNCGSVVSNPESDAQLICSDCGHDEFHVVQTVAPPPRRPSYTPFVPPVVPSTPAPRPLEGDVEDSPFVSPWARWAARTLDFWMTTFVAAPILGFLMASIGIDVTSITDFGWLLLCIPAGLVLDALCYHFFGWTLGKWLFAVKVSHQDEKRLTLGEYFKRNLWMLVKGQGLCIPIVALVMNVIQYNRLRDGKPASYDEGKDIRIVRAKHSAVRTFFGIVALVVMFVIMSALSAA